MDGAWTYSGARGRERIPGPDGAPGPARLCGRRRGLVFTAAPGDRCRALDGTLAAALAALLLSPRGAPPGLDPAGGRGPGPRRRPDLREARLRPGRRLVLG